MRQTLGTELPPTLSLQCCDCGTEGDYIGRTWEEVNRQAYEAGWRMKRFQRNPRTRHYCGRCLGLREQQNQKVNDG